ncbi:MAG: hypothetical protein AAF206_01865 [Bacteroidota bacterium]
MNFVSHYFLDRETEDAAYLLGVISPDLVSIFDRSVRLKENSLPLIMENESRPEEISFYNGLLRHFEVDALFHSSDFFTSETGRIGEMIRDVFEPQQVRRSFFVAHVLLELLLDKILIQRQPTLLDNFYRILHTITPEETVRLTKWATHAELPAYGTYFEKFIKRQYLYNYADWEHVIYVLRRIMNRVGIKDLEYLHQPQFLDLMVRYEAELAERSSFAFLQFEQQLCNAC